MVDNSININKVNNCLSFQFIELKKDHYILSWISKSWLGTDTKLYFPSPGLVQTQKCTFQDLAWYRHKNVHFKSWLGTDTKMYISSPGLVQTQKCTFQVLAWYRHKDVLSESWLGTDTKMYFPSPGLVQTQKCSISFNNIKSSSISGVNFFSWIFHKMC